MGKIKTGISAFGVFLITILVICALSLGGLAWRYFTAPIKGKVSAEEQIESAPSRITNYNHFYDLCANVKSIEQSLSAQQELLKSVSDDSKDRILSNIAGMKAQRARYINQYNSDADKAYTKARFLGEDLPRKLHSSEEITSCER